MSDTNSQANGPVVNEWITAAWQANVRPELRRTENDPLLAEATAHVVDKAHAIAIEYGLNTRELVGLAIAVVRRLFLIGYVRIIFLRPRRFIDWFRPAAKHPVPAIDAHELKQVQDFIIAAHRAYGRREYALAAYHIRRAQFIFDQARRCV